MNINNTLITTFDNVSNKDRFLNILSSIQWKHMVAGITGGVASTLILHPLDLVKVRLQVNQGLENKVGIPPYSGMMDTTYSIVKQAGFRGLYQGVVPNLWGAGASWGLYFFMYNTLKIRKQNGRKDVALDAKIHMLMAAEAGFFTLLLTNPIWVTKTRLCLQYDQKTSSKKQFSKDDPRHYKGMYDCLRKTYKYEGFHGLYKGLVPGLFGVSHGALQFMAYEELKKFYASLYDLPQNSKLGTKEYLCFAALSKIFAVILTYPYQVVRARLQDQHSQYTSLVEVIKQTYRKESWHGFFKGMVPGIIKVTPACCITFLIYENIIDYFNKNVSL